MSFLISDALAATSTATGPGGSPLGSIIMLVGFILIFYFLLWRPQNKRVKEHRELIKNLSKGDEVVTTGGMMGKIIKISEEGIILSIADGVEIRMQKNSIASSLPKGTLKSMD